MPFILVHQETSKHFLKFFEEDGYSEMVVDQKKQATRFPTEAAAIVALEDSDWSADYYPEYVKA